MTDDRSTREELLDAAYEVLVDPEYEGFTTAAVAAAADRNQSLVHYHFDTKAELIRALFDYLHGAVEDPIETIGEADDPAERLTSLLEFLVWADPDAEPGPTSLEEALAFKRGLLWLESRAPYDEDLRAAVERDTEYLREAVEDTIREGVESGRFREDVDPASVATFLLAAVDGAQDLGAIHGADARDDEVVETMERLIEEWLVA